LQGRPHQLSRTRIEREQFAIPGTQNATLMQAFMAVIMATPVYRHVEQLAVKEL
jgi:hypothetical protein